MNYLNPCWTQERLDAFWTVAQAQFAGRGRKGIIEAFEGMPADIRDWARATAIQGRIHTVAAPAFVLPILSHEGCDAILAQADSYTWKENEEEEHEYQMKEAVIAHLDPEFDKMLKSVLIEGAMPWVLMTRGRLPRDFSSLQLAQYSADDRAHGSLHIDRDSNYTCVISLNPEAFEGGGTVIIDSLIGHYTMPPLPKGYGLFFDGSTTLHAGLPVTKGTRKILTAWCHTKDDNW